MKNYYEILNIDLKSSPDDILKSFRKLAKRYHPDLNSNPNAKKMFIDIYEAYEILSDQTKRQLYDEVLLKNNTDLKDLNECENYAEEARARSYEYSNMKYKDFILKALKNIVGAFEATGIILLYTLINTFFKLILIISVVIPAFSLLKVYFIYSRIIFFLHLTLLGVVIVYLIYLDSFSWRTEIKDKNMFMIFIENKTIVVFLLLIYTGYSLYTIFM